MMQPEDWLLAEMVFISALWPGRGFPDSSVVKNLQCGRPGFDSWVGKISWRRGRVPTPVFLGFPGDSAGEESTCNMGDLGSIPGSRRSPGEGKGYPLQHSGLENSMDCAVHGVAESQTQLSDFHFPFLARELFSRIKILIMS